MARRRVAIGAEAGGGALELAVNRETGTWTAIITFADGSSCKLADGDGWQDLKAARRGQGS